MSEEERIASIREFNSTPGPLVLLSSMVLSDIRTEVIAADIVYITEPSNEGMVEEDALQNIIPRNKEQKLDVVHFVCKGTMEEMIMELRDKKKENPHYKAASNPEERIRDNLEDLCYLMKNCQGYVG